MLDVTVKGILYEDFHTVIELELEKEQEKNLPSNLYSIAEASFSSSCNIRAIWLADLIVGFLMYKFDEVETDQFDCTIWRFMIDRRHQNKGIGKKAMALLLGEIKENKKCKAVEIYYDERNVAAKKLYTQYGFRVVGMRDDGDIIAKLSI